ncbi:hypothetical protein GALMADRAFT_210578 [Galerina marginata CBS 339.88]|uniref:Uncharacterized protein n=1 Tax=Galerina marginata (strain CBS 339.88) TaxID=685588 RepID=A0A067T0K0_GALM3|nr:hypothetical protein GALMADRAFT_210578 [Galerina marginata CBS 339.88]
MELIDKKLRTIPIRNTEQFNIRRGRASKTLTRWGPKRNLKAKPPSESPSTQDKPRSIKGKIENMICIQINVIAVGETMKLSEAIQEGADEEQRAILRTPSSQPIKPQSEGIRPNGMFGLSVPDVELIIYTAYTDGKMTYRQSSKSEPINVFWKWNPHLYPWLLRQHLLQTPKFYGSSPG